ncbi:MAG TPA: hypothetical protein PLV92_28295, partial [Pirellulaceae bacterium]|nr:hypothetical protein [Pirellulaceae bacterium]
MQFVAREQVDVSPVAARRVESLDDVGRKRGQARFFAEEVAYATRKAFVDKLVRIAAVTIDLISREEED